MADAKRDQNNVPTLIAASSADGVTPTTVYANPTTHRLLVDSTAGVTGPGTSTDDGIPTFDGTTGETLQDSGVTIISGIVDATGYSAGGTSAVADGTYTIGAALTGGGVTGQIAVKGGIIVAIQEAT
jgi:hypothetical protein